MDFIKTLQSLENAVFEIVMWIMLLPKTLLQIIRKPSWIQYYVTKEWDKKPEERFQDYLSPILFWILFAVVPYAWSVTQIPGINEQKDYDTAIINSAISLIAAPIIYTLVIQKLHRKPIEKISLKRSFYIQCYCHTPIQLFSIILKVILIIAFHTNISPLQISSLAIGMTISNRIPSAFLFGAVIYLMILFLWQILLEIYVFRQDLKLGWAKAIRLVLIVQVIVLLIASYPIFVSTWDTGPTQ